jgi:hypothetical protein
MARMETRPLGPWWGLAGLLVAGSMLGLVGVGSFAAQPGISLVLMLTAGLGWALAVFLGTQTLQMSGRLWAGIALVALLGRAAAWHSQANLSDDLWRYGWEGALVLDGMSPYAQAPDDQALEEQRQRWADVFARMNNKSVSAAYPPVTQGYAAVWVALSVGLHGPTQDSTQGPAPADPIDAAASPVSQRLQSGLRLGFGLAELLVLWPLFALLKERRRPLGLLVAWAWSPLVMGEFWGAAHFDSLGVLCLAMALLGSSSAARSVRSVRAVWLGLAIGVKYLPLLLVPFFGWHRRVRGALVLALTLVCVFAPVGLLRGGYDGLFSGLSEYGFRWESWNLVYGFVEPAIGRVFEANESWTDPRRLGRMLMAALLVSVVTRQFLSERDRCTASYRTMAAFLILSPTLHPWYLAWVLVFVPLVIPVRDSAASPIGSSPSAWAWVYLITISPLLYWPLVAWQTQGVWHVPAWTWPLCGAPFFAVCLWCVVRRRAQT